MIEIAPAQMPEWARPTCGNMNAPIVVVCDAQNYYGRRQGLPIDLNTMKWFANHARPHGFGKGDIVFVGLCPPIPDEDKSSASRMWNHTAPWVEGVWQTLQTLNPRIIVTFGQLATRAIIGRSVKITKCRGVPIVEPNLPCPVFPMLSPGFVRRIPENEDVFCADIGTLANIRNADFDVSCIGQVEKDYQWVADLDELMQDRPRVISLDTETSGFGEGNPLNWWDENVHVIMIQICTGHGKVYAIAPNPRYDPIGLSQRARSKLIGQVKALLEDPNVRKIGQNLKYEQLMLRKMGIEVQGWLHDTQLLAFAVDENLLDKSLDTLIRVFLPEMSGYADEFNRTVDKSRMDLVPFEKNLEYGCGDADATYRVARILDELARQDQAQYRIYRRIQFPAILTFANRIERYGVSVDQDHLKALGIEVRGWLDTKYRELIQMVPAPARMRAMEAGKSLEFSRPDFVRDLLFANDCFNLTPRVFTKSTKDLPDDQKVPSTSSKDHLPYFVSGDHIPNRAKEFVTGLIEYQKTSKLEGTYIGTKEKSNGFWKYIAQDSNVYPSYMMHRTNTGRTASVNPNGQNWPKRGQFAKAYRKMFRARPGFSLVSADLSQIELRIAAWMAMEPTMLRVYQEGGDIHASTAAICLGMTLDEFMNLDDDYRKLQRFRAKAVNFGYIYGASATTFQVYAKTEYGVDYTDSEAQLNRERFFDRYLLIPWHESMRDFVYRHGFVRALHGAKRTLPSIHSNDHAIVAFAERQAINAPVQRFGSDLGVIAMNRFSAQADPDIMRIVAFIHDDLIMEVWEGHEEEAACALMWVMENPPLQQLFGIIPPLPIVAEPSIGLASQGKANLADMEEVKGLASERPSWWVDDFALET